MAQIITARLARIDSQPWGFRLQGGKDFGTPLVIQKVHTGSIADKAGLQAGDAVVRINQTDLFNLRHKDAQDAIVQGGPSFELVVQRGGATWKPTVTPISSAAASPIPGNFTPVTKTSLAANKQPVSAIGTGHNTAARPFVPPSPVRSIVNKQYNSPVAMYSEETIAETLTSQAEVLAGGCLGVNFKKNEKVYNPEKSEVLKALQENDSEPEPVGSSFYSKQSHAIGGSALTYQCQRPLTPSYQTIPDSRIGTALQANVLAPPATHRPSLPVHPVQPVQKPAAPQPEQKQPEIVNIVPPTLPVAAPPQISIDGVFVRIKDKNLHVECFKCATCGTSLKNQGYYNLNNKLYCDVHARLAAMNSPPPNSNGLVPVAIPPKNLGASTISSALNAHAGNLNGNHNINESQISPTSTLVSKGTKVNDDNNNNIVCDNRYISETDCSSISSSDKENDSRPSSSHGNNINKSDITNGNDTDGFHYRTINGRVIKSVIPPGKGIKVNYKVPSNISGPKPFSYTQAPIQVMNVAVNPPMAAPKSPSSYPPPNQPTWAPPSAAPVAPKPAGPVQEFIDIEKCNGKPREEEKTKKKKEDVYVPCTSEDEFDPQELVKIAKPPPSNFIWPPIIEEPKVPIAAPIYVPVPETLHVTAKPCTNVRPLGRPAPRLTTQSLRTIETTSDCECLHVESNITATTSTTSNASSESEYKMYQTQNNHYVNMFEQHEQQQQQEQQHDDEVEEINKQQIEIDLRKTPPQIELPKDIKTVEFVEPEPGYQPETFLNVFSKKKETWQKMTQNVVTTKVEERCQQYLTVDPIQDDNPDNSDVEDIQQVEIQQEVIQQEEIQHEEIQQEDTEVEEINEMKEEVIETQEEVQEGQHVGKYDGTYYQLAPSNIPQPVPKGYQSNLQKALVYSSDKPYSIRNMPPTPEPRFPSLDLYERAVREAATEPKEEPQKKKEIPKFEVKATTEHRDFPHNEQEVRPGNTLLSSMMRTASPRQMEFIKSNIIEEITLPDELDAYFPPPISMVPNEPYPSLKPYRTKSPFVSALTIVSDRPFTPFGREIKSQLSLEPPQCNAPKSTFSNALHTAPDESFDPSSLEYEYIENNPIEYTAKVYERIAVEATGDEETTHSSYQHVESFPVTNQDPYQRAYIHKIQPWSTPSEQVAESTYRDSISSSQASTECNVSDSRRCSEFVVCDSRRTSRAANECAVSDSRRTSRTANEYAVSESRRASEYAVSDSRRCSEAVNEPCCVKKNIRDLLKFDEPEEEFDPDKPCPNAPYPRRQEQPSPFEGMQVKITNKMTSSLHKPDEIPQYQRKWFNLPTQNPPRTPEPEELRENVPVAFKEWHETKQIIASQSESVQRKEIRVTFAEKPPIPYDTPTNSRRGSVSEKIQWMEQTKAKTVEQEEVKFPTKTSQRNENAFPTRSMSIEEKVEEEEDRDEFGDIRFPTRSPAPPAEGSFPLKGIRKNSIFDIQERQDKQFAKQKTLKQELEMQQQRMQQKHRVRQQVELQNMQKNYEKLAQNSIVEEIQQNKTLSAYEQEQEYKRQLELEKQQRQKEKELKEQQARELEYQRQIEEKRLQEIRFQEKRERDIQIQAQREAEYQKHREEQEEALRIQQEERDREMRRQQEEIEKEILKQQEQERKDAERREARRLFEIRRKEERDRELVRLETELREKREQELKQLEREIREKREQRQREEKEAEIQQQQERKAREDAEKEAKRLEQEAIRLQKESQRQLHSELKLRQKQEADRKQREEMELFNIEEERKKNEELTKKAKSYEATTYAQQMVWPPSTSSTPAPNQVSSQTPMSIPIIRTDSETELNAPKFHFEPLDEEQKRFMAAIRPPSTCYSPPTEQKPYPSIPYYQQHLAFYETAPDHCGIFDPRSVSPVPVPIQNRSRSPAFGPPPNPLRAFVNKERDPVVDESGIYLCGERLLSPVWYEKGNKKIPPPVQRRIHPHAPSTAHPPPKPDLEAIKESIKNKRQAATQESDTKPPPTPPPMPKASYKATLPAVKNEAPEIKTQTIPITNNKESMIATDLLKESVDRLNINTQNSDFRKNASGVLAAMLEARMIKKQQNQGNKFEDPEFLPPPPPLPSTKPPNPNIHQDLPLPPPPSPCKIPSSILTPPLSSDENDFPQKKNCGNNNNNNNTEKVIYRHKKHHHSNSQSPDSSPSSSTSSFHGISKPELSTHARDRRSYIEKNNNNTNGHHYSGNEISFNNSVDKDTLDSIATGIANGQHPVCDKCKCKITRGPFVTALGRTWCPAHFLCVNQNCKRELMDIGFVEEKGDLYCEYCFEQFLAPPCSKCNGKIKGDCLNAIGRKFHPECFKCTYCSKLFGNNPFFLEEGEPYCEADWNELFTTKCFACGFPVEAGDRWVEALNNNYHSQCFNCTYCKKNLEGQSFFAKGGRPFCKNHAR